MSGNFGQPRDLFGKDLYIQGKKVIDKNFNIKSTTTKANSISASQSLFLPVKAASSGTTTTTGSLLFDTDTSKLSVFNGTAWSAAALASDLAVFQPKCGGGTPPVLQFELISDTAPLNYCSTRAVSVIQHRDTLDGGFNDGIPAQVIQNTSTGNGVVNSSLESSSTIWMGQYVYHKKTGDGSAQQVTFVGELGPAGPGGYNEMGGFCGINTNFGSNKAYISGVEVAVLDSPDLGVHSYDTRLQAVVGRVSKYHSSMRNSACFYASSEGSQPVGSVLSCNPQGLAQWFRGIDLKDATFTSGQACLFPNNTNLAWLTQTGNPVPVLYLSGGNDVYLSMSGSTTAVNITTNTAAIRLSVNNDPYNAVSIFVGGALQTIQAGAPNSGGMGYRQLIIPN